MVEWTLPAKEDLKNIYEYVSRDSKFYGRKIVEEIIELSESLSKFPRMGRVVHEIGNPEIREIIIYSYRLIYKVEPKGIKVLALIHGRRNFSKIDIK